MRSFGTRSRLFVATALAALLGAVALIQGVAIRPAPRSSADYLDKAVTRLEEAPAANPAPANVAKPVGEPARAPRAIGVSNGSYDTKVDGSTFVIGMPAASESKFGMRFGPVVVKSSGIVMSGGNTGEYLTRNGGFEADRGAIAERYMYDLNRVEQLVVIPAAPEGKGAITVESPIELPSDSKVTVQNSAWADARFGKGGLLVTNADGEEVAAVYGARVIDSAGRQQDLAMGWNGSAMTMTVPASFVAIAQYPITVDPWIQLAGSGVLPGIPTSNVQTPENVVDLARGPLDEPVVAWATDTTDDIVVRRFNTGTVAWEDLPSLAPFTTAAVSTDPSVACLPGTLSPIVAWTEDNAGTNAIHVRQFLGGAWVELTGSATTAGISTAGTSADSPSVAITTGGTGTSFIAWRDSGDPSSPIFVKTGVFPGPFAPASVGSASGTGISGAVGGTFTASDPEIAIDSLGRPVVAWHEFDSAGATANYIWLRRLEAGVWVELAGSGSTDGLTDTTGATRPTLAIDANNNPIVAWEEVVGGVTEIHARRFNPAGAGSWDPIGTSTTGTGISDTPGVADSRPSIGTDSYGNPLVTWQNLVGASNQIFVKRWNGFAWQQLEGSATGTGISATPASGPGNVQPSLAIDSTGRAMVAWRGFGDSARYRQYQGLGLPTAINQTRLGGSVIAPPPAFGSTGESAVRFEGFIVSNLPGDEGRLQIEVKPIGTPFTGLPTAESPLTPAGTLASVIIPLVPGTYHWQARTESITATNRSAWQSFPLAPATNSEFGTDFQVGVTPAAPVAATLEQRHLDTDTALASGASTLGGGAIFRCTPGLLPADMRLQIDFTGDSVADVESPIYLAGSSPTISIPVSLALGSYNWSAAFATPAGVSSSFTSFPGGPPDFVVAAATSPVAPAAPISLATFRIDGTTPTPAPPAFVPEGFVIFRATTTGAPGDLNRIQVDYTSPATLGVPDGIPDAESALVAPGTVVSIAVPVSDGGYNWQARQQSSASLDGPYAVFAGSPDFVIDSPFVGTVSGAPAALGQFRLDGVTAIAAVTGTTTESGVTFRATLPVSTDLLKLQIEVGPSGSAFPASFVPDAESAFISTSAGAVVVDVTIPLGVGTYQWRVRSMSSAFVTSAPVEFALGTGIDFSVIVGAGTPPTAPVTLNQLQLDATPIAFGGSTSTSAIVFQVTVPGLASDLNRAQIDFETGGVLDGIPDVESALVPGGSVVNITVPLPPGSYDWAARASNALGASSAYTPFNAGTPDFIVTVAAGAVAPGVPTALAQFNLGGLAIAPGGTATGDTVILRGTVSGLVTDLNRLRIDVGATTDGIADVESPLVPGGSIVNITLPLGAGAYDWAAQTQSSFGLTSAFVPFTPAGSPDFTIPAVAAPVAPAAPSTLTQRRIDASVIALGGTTSGSTVVFEVVVPGLITDLNRIQVDFSTGALDGFPNLESPLSPGTSTIQITAPLADGSYNWAARAVSSAGLASAYTAFDAASPDFVVAAGAAPPTPAVPVSLAQELLDGTAITAAPIFQNTVVFEVAVPGLVTDLNRIQIDVEAGATDGIVDLESPLVPGGTTVQVTVSLGVGAYNWAARTQSSFGTNSAFTPFLAGSPDFTIASAPAPVAPVAPTTLVQRRLDGSVILSGGTTSGSTVVFEVVVPGVLADLNRVQVDFSTGVPDGNPDLESPIVPGTSTIQITASLGDASYNWQARGVSSAGAAGPYAVFPGGPADFVVAAGAAPPTPAAPATLAQLLLDGTTPIASGGTVTSNTLVFQVLVPGAGTDLNRIQVDVEVGAFDTVPEFESPLVAGGSTVSIVATLPNGVYNWQARTLSSFGTSSLYTGFAGGPPDFTIASLGSGPAPSAPVTLVQERLDGSAILSGATTTESTVVFEVVVPGLATDLNRIQVDVEAGAPDGIADVESVLVPGGSTVNIAVPLADGDYNWQARTMSSTGLTSAFTAFAGGPDDFVVATGAAPPVAPTVPVVMDQLNLDGTSIVSGGTSTGSTVKFQVTVPGLVTDLNRIQVDYSTGAPDGNPEVESPLVAGGSVVEITVSLANGSYEWQARTQSSLGANSGYTAFAGGPPDFVVSLGGATPAAPAGLTQTNPDASVIVPGATAAGNTVVFSGTVTTAPAGGTGRLQVEFTTGGFSGIPDVESPLVPDGTTVSIAVSLGDGLYEWQARNQGSAGAVSAYTEFVAGVATDFEIAAGTGGAIPGVPTGLSQLNLDGSAIPVGGSATGNTAVFEGIVGGTPGSLGRLQVEFITGVGFTAVPDVESPLVTAGSTVQIAVPFAPGSYQWQARSQTSTGAVSAFVEFVAGGATDYIINSLAGGAAPADPIGVSQFRLDGVSGIPVGATIDDDTVVFRATLPGAVVDLNRMQIEVIPTLGVFTGNPSFESPLVPGGATVSIVVPFSDGSYKWRARSQSATTAVSLWVDHALTDPDFIINTAGVVPPVPSGLAQNNPGPTPIGLGATAATDVVIFSASVTSLVPGETVRLQVDFAGVGGLSGVPDIESPLVPSGTSVSITVPLGDGGYEWAARTLTSAGAASAYVPFGGSSGVTNDFVVAAGAGGVVPAAPSALVQRRLDGTPILLGGTTSGDTVVFEGLVTGAPGSFLRLEVEFVTFGSGLGGVPDVESPLVPTGSTVQIAVAHGDGNYEWQARTRTSTGAVSLFTPFGGASGVVFDFTVAAGSGGVPPSTPSFLGQFQINGIFAIPVGGTVADDKVIFRASLPGALASLVRLQVEYIDTAAIFSGNATIESPLVPGSSTVSIAVPIADGAYQWRARAQSSTGASSAWVDFAAPAGTDFNVASAGFVPPAPTGLAQETLAGTPIGAGATTFSDTVVFRSTVVSGSPGGLVKMQVEFAGPSSLSGIPDVESPLVPSGTSVTIAVPIGDGSYEWQARAVSPTGLASAFVLFGGAPAGLVDFVVSAGTGGPTPSLPAGLAQKRLDGALIPSGGTTSGNTVVFEGLVSGAPGSLLRLQVEFSLFGSGFTGIPDVESALVPTGSTVQIAVPLGDGAYEWQARTQSSLGAVSLFTPFALAGIDFNVASSIGGTPPGPPSALEQRTIAGALVLSGSVVSDDSIVFRGTVPGTPVDLNRLQVEYVILPTVFTGVPSVESPLVPGGSVVSIVAPVADGSYGWQARAQSSFGGSSGYIDFGAPADIDFIIQSNGVPPPVPSALAQEELDTTLIPVGGTTFEDTVVFRATTTGALPGDIVRLQVDFSAPGSLANIADVESPAVPSGTSVTIAVPLADGSYEWQVRTVGPAGAVSAWVEFVAGAAIDFIVDAGTGLVPPIPAALDQQELDTTPVPSGGTIFSDTIVFVGTVTTTDGSLARLQIDYSPVSGEADIESPFVATGSVVTIAVPLADGPYAWEARTVASTGAASLYAPFPGGPVDFIIDADQSTNPPATPIVLGQQDSLATAVPVGGSIVDDDVTLFATLPGLPADLFRLQIEVKPVAVVFTGVPDVQSILIPGGGTAFITIPLGDGNYHWRARSQSSVGVNSAWLEFGANPTVDVDFNIDSDFPGFAPPIPTALDQVDSNGQSMPEGDDTFGHIVTFQGVVTGDPALLFKLQVEVRRSEESFTGLPNFDSIFVSSGSTASVSGDFDEHGYHWRARTITSHGVVSPWVSFGANADGEIDFDVIGRQSDGHKDGNFFKKARRHCGLTGLEVPFLMGFFWLGRKAVRRVRRSKKSLVK